MLLSREQMFEQWRLRHCFKTPLETGIEYCGTDSSELLESTGMNDWYLDYLDRAPVEAIETSDIHALIGLSRWGVDGAWRLDFPEGCRRIVSLSVEGAPLQVRIVGPDSREAILQCSPFATAGRLSPIAVRSRDGSMVLYAGKGAKPVVTECIAVMLPPEGFYRITPRGLSMIGGPDSGNKLI